MSFVGFTLILNFFEFVFFAFTFFGFGFFVFNFVLGFLALSFEIITLCDDFLVAFNLNDKSLRVRLVMVRHGVGFLHIVHNLHAFRFRLVLVHHRVGGIQFELLHVNGLVGLE